MKLFFIVIIFLFYACSVMGQGKLDDMDALKLHVDKIAALANTTKKSFVKIQKTYNPVKLILFLPLYCYQKIVSEQISADCGFVPSCSAFSILSIKKFGILKGLLLTADRLTRCNGDAQIESEYYLFDPHKAKVIDDPDMYRFKN